MGDNKQYWSGDNNMYMGSYYEPEQEYTNLQSQQLGELHDKK